MYICVGARKTNEMILLMMVLIKRIVKFWYVLSTIVFLIPTTILCYPYVEDQVHCAIRKEISPCTCYNYSPTEDSVKKVWINVICRQMNSFSEVVHILQKKFDPGVNIMLQIEYSNLDDLPTNKFKNINSDIKTLKVNNNDLLRISSSSFEEIGDVRFLSLADNKISEFPGLIFKHMPNMQTLEVSRTLIKHISPRDFESLQNLKHLFFSECNLTVIESGTFPPTLTSVSLASNNLTTLNQTLRFQKGITRLDIRDNHIKSLEGELPDQTTSTNLSYIDISSNEVDHIPQSFRNLTQLNYLTVARNRLTALNNTLQKLPVLSSLDISRNQIQILYSTDFSGTDINSLCLEYNEVPNLNGSLLPLINLKDLKAAHGKLSELSMSEFTGLFKLEWVDLSYNKISKIVAFENAMLPKAHINQLNLDNNQIEKLEGSLGGIIGLTNLSMNHNRIQSLPADFLDGLQSLKYFDISYNFLNSLEDTSKITLPSLSEIKVTHNELTTLGQDLHGFPSLCWVNLAYNKITTIKPEFSERTQCKFSEAKSTLWIYLDGNAVVCDDDMKDVIKTIENKSGNSTKFAETKYCSPPKELKYSVNGSDSSPITVVTLEDQNLKLKNKIN